MACVSTALVVGGGIAGLAAAIALSRVGVKCDVVEISDAHLGATLGVNLRAANALDELGAYDECAKTERVWNEGSAASANYDAAGKMINPGPSRPNLPDAKTAMAVYRPTMLGNMEEMANELGVKIHKRTTTRKIDSGDESCLVTFSDGEERRYDLVVGADGIGSPTRKQVFPDAPKPVYAGQVSLRWMAPGPRVMPEGWYTCPLGKVGIYYMPALNEVMVAGVISESEWARKTDDEVYLLFANLLGAFTAPAMVELRQRLTPDSNLICRPFEWLLVPPPWYRGRTVLIGDAAHATTAHMGMGGGMALEDAVVLAQCVSSATTLREAFEVFMERRLTRVRTVVETSVSLSRLEQEKAPLSENKALLDNAFAVLVQPY